jgi:hypothetical protein
MVLTQPFPVALQGGAADERAARRTLRAQIARLESQLGDAFVTAFTMGGLEPPPTVPAQPRLLSLGELETARDELAERLRVARLTIARGAEERARKRLLLERMLLEPGRHRFVRVSCRELGEPGCGVYRVQPRLGLIGMLMGWWQVTLSSGCPLPRRHARVAEDRRRRDPGRVDHDHRLDRALAGHAAAVAVGRVADPG